MFPVRLSHDFSRQPQFALKSWRVPLDPPRPPSIDSLLRRARGASRLKPHREALRGSGRSAGVVDESIPGSAKCWSDLSRAQSEPRKLSLLRKKSSQFAGRPFPTPLTPLDTAPRFAIAPSWLRPSEGSTAGITRKGEVSRRTGTKGEASSVRFLLRKRHRASTSALGYGCPSRHRPQTAPFRSRTP